MGSFLSTTTAVLGRQAHVRAVLARARHAGTVEDCGHSLLHTSNAMDRDLMAKEELDRLGFMSLALAEMAAAVVAPPHLAREIPP